MTSNDFASRLQAVDRALLTPLVRDVLCEETANVIDWATFPVGGGATQETGRTYGLYRFQGSAQLSDQCVPWSLILKATAGSLEVDNDPASWGYWKRELSAYQSGLLADLPGDVVAPRCFAVVEYPGDEFWIWLEDIPPEQEPTWSLERYALAAHHLGTFNGAYLADKPLPDESWLSTGRVRDWLDRSEEVLRDLPTRCEHPLARRWFRGNNVVRTLQLWRDQNMLLEPFDRLPRTLCHHDAFRRNLIFRPTAVGHDQLVAVDWEVVGTGAIGEEIATLVGISLQFLDVPVNQAKELDAIVFQSYVDGLREAGWTGDERLVRFGFAATAALFIGAGAVGPFLDGLTGAEDPVPIAKTLFGCTPEYLVDQYALLQEYLLDLGDEARAMLSAVS